jgi:hypothetical protein
MPKLKRCHKLCPAFACIENSINLIELYNKDNLFRLAAKPIMLQRSRLNWKRDQLRAKLKELGLDDNFTMADLRELHYYLHPEDEKRV